MATTSANTSPVLPRIAITFCTQCRWMLRAAYFAQELLSTFSTAIGEVALIPATGGIFTVDLTYQPTAGGSVSSGDSENATVKDGSTATSVKQVRLWEFKTARTFPETKVLKQLVRDHLQPTRDLGHSDRGGKKAVKDDQAEAQTTSDHTEPKSTTGEPKAPAASKVECADCQ